LFAFSGCYTQTHIVGDGAKGSTIESAKSWYILFGLVPLNNVDSKAMAQGAKDYTITTQQSFIDVVIGLFTGMVTVYPRTVQVQR
jgi:hypothetical protein